MNLAERVSGVILAGGRSRRMGSDKRWIPVGGQPMLERTIALLAPWCGEVLVVVGPEELSLADQRARVVHDRLPAGPLGGLEAALGAMRSSRAVVVGCDMPLLDSALLQHLSSLCDSYDAVIPVWDGQAQPLHGVYSATCLPLVQRLLAGPVVPALSDLLAAANVLYVGAEELQALGADGSSFLNMNTPSDLATARALADGGAPGPVPAIAVVGRSDSGKTTLIEGLIRVLKERGYRIAAVKRSTHPVEVDVPGKDSWRLARAGTDAVLLVAPDKVMLVERTSERWDLEQVLARLGPGYDLVLLEGYSETDLPKIEVYRPEIGPLRSAPEELMAVISDTSVDSDLPRFRPDEVAQLACFLEERGYLGSLSGARNGTRTPQGRDR